MNIITRDVAVSVMVLLGMPAVAMAQEGRSQEHAGHPGMQHRPEAIPGHGPSSRRVEPWHGDIRQFRERDMPAWRAGRWYHGPHGGREGWWWIVGLNWYFYPGPVYPYPDPYLPPPAAAIAPAPGVEPQYWYYCANPAGYYPYVPQCYGNWERVPASVP